MVNLQQVKASNAQIATSLSPNLVAVFVGATSGIGEYTLKAFAQYAKQPRVYFVGRSEESGQRIKAECEALSKGGEFIFIKSDVSLLKNVDVVCRQIKEKERTINLLVQSQGTLVFGTESEEGLHYANALAQYSRLRFALNLLPLLQHATGLRRAVSIFAGTKEGTIDLTNIQGRNMKMWDARGHGTAIMTFTLETLAKKAPEVGFVHVYPGFVKTNIARGTSGIAMTMFKAVSMVIMPFLAISPAETGERHLFLSTSQRYAGREGKDNGVALAEGVSIARGSDGQTGSGVYSVDENGESANAQVEKILADQRNVGVSEKVWDLIMEDMRRVTGSDSI